MAKRGRPRYPGVLTPREQEVLALLRERLTNQQIAERLSITERTAKYHVAQILSKLGAESRAEAAAWTPDERPARVLALLPFALTRFSARSWLAPAALTSVGVAVVGGAAVIAWGMTRTHESPAASAARYITPTIERTVVPNYAIDVDQSSAQSVDALVDDSDAVVIATVLGSTLVSQPFYAEIPLGECTPIPENAGKGCPTTLSGTFGYYQSDYELRVERTLKGSEPSPQYLVMREVGGIVDGVAIIQQPFPFYEAGATYLIFVRRDNERGELYTTAADFGAYQLIDGWLHKLPDAGPYYGGAPLALDGLSENEAISLIEGLVAQQVRS